MQSSWRVCFSGIFTKYHRSLFYTCLPGVNKTLTNKKADAFTAMKTAADVFLKSVSGENQVDEFHERLTFLLNVLEAQLRVVETARKRK